MKATKRQRRFKGLYRQSLSLLGANFSALLWFEVLYKLLSSLVLYPIILFFLDLAIDRSGLEFLTDKNFSTFLSNPVSLLIGILLVLTTVVFALYELSALTVLFEMSRTGQKVNTVEVAFAGLTRLRKFFHPGGFIFFFVILAATTLLDLPFASSLISVTGIPDYLDNTFLKKPLMYAGLIVLSVVVLWLFWSYIFVIHHTVLHNRSLKEAVKATRKAVHGHRAGLNLRFLIWYSGVFLVHFIVYTIVIFLSAGVISVVFPADSAPSAFLVFSRWVGHAATFLLYSFFTPFFFVIVSAYFSRLNGEAVEEASTGQGQFSIRRFKSHRLIMALVLVTIVAANAGIFNRSLTDGIMRRIVPFRTTEITAHRGSSLRAPENTLEAIEKAMEEGADFAEIDVRMTADGYVVLMHDASLQRTAGVKINVWEISRERLDQLEAGSFFSSEYSGARIPSLEEAIDVSNGRIRLNIEIKPSSETPDLARETARIILEKEWERECVVTSFSREALSDVKSVSPEIRTGLIITMPLGSYTRLMDVDFYSLNALFLSARQAEMIHALGYEIHVWGAKDAQTIRRMVEYGADNIITADPLLATETIYSHSANDYVIFVAGLFFESPELVSRGVTVFPFRY